MTHQILLLAGALLFNQVVRAQTPSYQGTLLIQPVANNAKCLQSQNGNVNGSPVVITDCTDSVDQQFTFQNGALTLYGGTMCLDVTNGANVDGTKLQIWTCYAGSTNQQWYWTTDNHLAWTNQGKCLDLTDGSQTNGNQVQIYDCTGGNANQIWNVGYWATNLPSTSQNGQYGTNNCGTSDTGLPICLVPRRMANMVPTTAERLVHPRQTARLSVRINSVDDFCLWGPPVNDSIGDTEREQVAYCTHGTHGSRVFPAGTFSGVHFVKTPDYVQITGQGDFTKINIPNGDEGGELDNHGADGNGNPIGGLIFGNVFGTNLQFHEWTEFIAYNEFCIRACIGPNAAVNCNHIYDVMGCYWNMPANYDTGVFESCDGVDGEPMGVYGTSTWYQGVSPTPAAHTAPASSNCVTTATVGTGS